MDKRKPIVIAADKLTRHRLSRSRGPLGFRFPKRRVVVVTDETHWYELALRCRCRYGDGKYGDYYPLRPLRQEEIDEVVGDLKGGKGSGYELLAMLVCFTFDEAIKSVISAGGARELVYDRTPEDERDHDFHEGLAHLDERLGKFHDDLDRLEMTEDFTAQLLLHRNDVNAFCTSMEHDPEGGFAGLLVFLLKLALKVYLQHHGVADILSDIAVEHGPAELRFAYDIVELSKDARELLVNTKDLEQALSTVRMPDVRMPEFEISREQEIKVQGPRVQQRGMSM